MHGISLKEIMTKSVVTVNVADRFSIVEKRLRENKIRHLPVVDNKNHVVGLVSQRDLYRISPPRKTSEGDVYDTEYLDGFILSSVMTPIVQTLSDQTAFKEAVYLMVEKKLGCIPVIDKDEHLCGILTKTDVLKFLSRSFRNAEGLK